MKRSTVIISAVIMCLALVVAIVGITAAWFGDINKISDILTITSEKPKGSVTIDISSGREPGADDLLIPAIANNSWLLLNKGSVDLASIDVLDTNLKGDPSSKPLKDIAHKVAITFDFKYDGGSDTGYETKAVFIEIKTVTLLNPRDGQTDISKGMTDYIGEFNFIFSLVKLIVEDDPLTTNIDETQFAPLTAEEMEESGIRMVQEGTRLYMEIKPFKSYTFQAEIYFAKVDEECSPDLIDTQLYFNFEIAAISKSQMPA